MTGTTARIGVDVGGTFTDLVLHDRARNLSWTGKRLTTPEDPGRAILDGIGHLLRESHTDISQVGTIVHGTTLVTNTLLERSGAKTALITTAGFRDVLEIGREIRFDVDDLYARHAPALVPRRLCRGVGERMRADGSEHTPLDESDLLRIAKELVEDEGIEALTVGFLHSYANPAHELRAREVLHAAYPGLPLTLSAEVAAEFREYDRLVTACVNSYVQPRVYRYLADLRRGLHQIGFGGSLRIMLSSGGLTTAEDAAAFPVRLLESGPAAGAIAAAYLARAAGERKVISFDMGGTTAKMCLVEDGHLRVKHEFEAARQEKFTPGSGMPLKLTVVDMIEIGSGGGSIGEIDSLGLLKVGPRSAGSVPGPVAYGQGGGQPTVTDSDLLLGLLDPGSFLGGEMPLDLPRARTAMAEKLADPLRLTTMALAAGMHEVVAENMAAATRMHLAEKGKDPSEFTLMAFGGAGPVHAYTLAKRLKIKRIIVPMGAGVASAFGFLVAAPTVDEVRGYATPLTSVNWDKVAALYQEMTEKARALLDGTQGAEADVRYIRTVDMRYVGQGFEIEVPMPAGPIDDSMTGRLASGFADTYRDIFGRTVEAVEAQAIAWRLSARQPETSISLAYQPSTAAPRRSARIIHFPGLGGIETPVYDRYALTRGTTIRGPALFEERDTSFCAGPDCSVTVDENFNLVTEIGP